MPRHLVEHHDAEQEQAAAQQAEDHIAHGGQCRAAELPDHQQPAGGQRADLDEHIARENVVRERQRQQRREHEVTQDVIEVLLRRLQIVRELLFAAEDAQEHHGRERRAVERLEPPEAQLVAPRVRIMSHEIGHGLARLVYII